MKNKTLITLLIFGLVISVYCGEKVAKEDQTEDANKSRKEKVEGRSKKIKELLVLAQNALKEKKDKDAIEYYTKAAKLGDSSSQCFLGSCYLYGMYGKEKDIDKAVHWYRRASKQGNKLATEQLSRCFASGKVETKRRVNAKKRAAKLSEKSHKP